MDFTLLFTVISSLIIVIVISGTVSRLSSLPVDMASAAVSLAILFVETAQGVINRGRDNVSDHAVLLVGLILAVSILLTFISIGVFLVSEFERKQLKIQAGEHGSLFTEAGYCISLLFATLFIILHSL